MAVRILSLDGGGSWALLQAMALEDLYPGRSGHEILRDFDIAVANSGGSIVLAGLMLDMRPADIQRFFADSNLCRAIFYKKPWPEPWLSRHVPIFPRYVTAKKRLGLRDALGPLGDITLADWPQQIAGPNGLAVRIMIVAFDYDRQREIMLRSYGVPATGAEAEAVALVDAVHASTNAPVTYFDAPAIIGNKRYWDGAMGAYNNPLMAAVVDALALGAGPHEIEALSLGTGTVRLVPPSLVEPGTPPQMQATLVRPSLLNNAKLAASCITDDPPDAATFTAHIVLGNPPQALGRVIRMSPVVRPVKENGTWAFPKGLDASSFEKLTKLGMDAMTPEEIGLISHLGRAWMQGGVPNQPIRMRYDLESEPGDATYADAKWRWLAMAHV